MPFCSLTSPSLALSLFKAALSGCGIQCTTRYYSFAFARLIGKEFYARLADGFPHTTDFLGEWIFSQANHGYGKDRDSEYLTHLYQRWHSRKGGPDPSFQNDIELAKRAKRLSASFLSDCADDVLSGHPTIVGITSTFQQHQASIGLAIEIKRRMPTTIIVLGGANCEGEMGLQTAMSFDAVDVVVSGEGDIAFPAIVGSVLEGRGIPRLDGVLCLKSSAGGVAERPYTTIVENLDELPTPDFSDYFKYLERDGGMVSKDEIRLPIETSRGCWWGEKSHCTFCGLNGHAMRFRSKSPSKALKEFADISEAHSGVRLSAVDNILDYRYFNSVIPQLAKLRDSGTNFDIFYEVKANIKFEKLELMASAGIKNIQPGIESLSTNVLQLMRKGIKAIHNVQLLKHCRELEITPHWNLIWGFPGEDPAEYRRVAELIPSFFHLFPPSGFSQIRLDRFSPNFTHAEMHGFTNVRPFESYNSLYDLPADEIARLAYFFQYDYKDGRSPAEYTEGLLLATETWRARYPGAELLHVENDGAQLIIDSREPDVRAYLLNAEQAAVLEACRDAQPSTVVHSFAKQLVADWQPVLAKLIDVGLLLSLDSYYLALPLKLGRIQPKDLALRRIVDRVQGDGLMSINL
jgi:ribosomal peptide maturation radical SAM protein 1